MRKLIAILLLVLFLPSVTAVIPQGTLPIYAVTENDKGLEASLIITIEPGTGKVWSSVNGPLIGTTTQNTEKIAVGLANNYFDKVDNFDYKFDIVSSASVVEGPSAGAAMALLTISLLLDEKIPGYVSLTGTITEEGRVGPVGGVFAKAREAADNGRKLFMIPRGETIQTQRFDDGIRTINLTSYAFEEWGLKVVEVDNIDQVLRYVRTPLDDIDINAITEDAPPIFSPEKIEVNQKLTEFNPVASSLLERAKKEVERAKKSLETTGIDSTIIINALFNSLNSSEKSLDEAALVLENNYFYSGANLTFLSIVNAGLVRDLSENPSLLDSDSFWLERETNRLENNLEQLEAQIDSFYSLENFEWSISARERLTWAQMEVSKLKNESLVVIIGSSKDEELVQTIDKLRDFQFAKAWYEVSLEFNNLSKQKEDLVKVKPFFQIESQEIIQNAESELTRYGDNIPEDVKRRFDASVIQNEKGWHVAAAVDAASAMALSQAEKDISGLNYGELVELLESEINNTKDEMQKTGRDYIWPQLYIDHANYYLESAKFFKERDFTNNAIDNARAGISLVYLAREILTVLNEAYLALENAETVSVDVTDLPIGTNIGTNTSKTIDDLGVTENQIFRPAFLALILIAGLMMVLILLFSGNRHKNQEKNQVKKLEDEKRALSIEYSKGNVAPKKYQEVSSLIDIELKEKNSILEEKSKHLIRIDALHQEIDGLNHFIKKTKRRFELGEVTVSAYKEAMVQCNERLSSLNNRLENEIKELDEAELKLAEETKKEKELVSRIEKRIAPTKKVTSKNETSKNASKSGKKVVKNNAKSRTNPSKTTSKSKKNPSKQKE